jgi:hypothetical protein
MRALFLFSALLLCYCLASAQFSGWTIDPFDERYFIENKGQFAPIGGEAVIGAMQNKGEEVMFMPKGFIYRFIQVRSVPAYSVEKEEEMPENERENHLRNVHDTLSLHVDWVGANPVAIDLEDPQSPVFHYARKGGGQIAGARSFKTMDYQELYPQIDLGFGFHPVEGIKYNFTVYPGGDPSQIQMALTGMDSLYLDGVGNLHARLGDVEWMDHAPVAYVLANGAAVPCRFVLTGDTVRLEVGQYDRAKTLIIDPWMMSPAFTTENKAFDIHWDCGGNVYVFGGRSPWKVKKFNSAGTLQWTYNTNHTDWYGDLVSDDLGNLYIVEGCCDGNREKLNTAGVMQWTINNGVYEFWRLAFSCDFSRLSMATAYVPGGPIVPMNSLSTVNTTTGAVSGGVNIASAEPRTFVPAPNGNYYALTAVGNQLLARNNTYGPIYAVGNGYSLLYNGPLYANGTNPTSGQNGIAVYQNFIFTTNGATLMKRDLATGGLIASIALPSGSAEQFSGVAVDNCGNVFAGTNANVYRYDANLVLQSSFAVTGAVYDISVSGLSQVLVAGNGFIASENAPCASYCHACVVFPESLTDFEVNANAQGEVEVSWNIATPGNYAQYGVERSADGVNYEELEVRASAGNAYAVLDAAPLRGYSWYRLALKDLGGAVSYGPARQVWIAQEGEGLSVYPIPVEGRMFVQLPGEGIEGGSLQLYDAQGRLVLEHYVADARILQDMDMSGLEDGIYVLRVKGTAAAPVRILKME